MAEEKLSLIENYFKKGGRYDKRMEELAIEVIQGLTSLSQNEKEKFLINKLKTFVDNTKLHLIGFRHRTVENDFLLIKRGGFENTAKELYKVLQSF